MRPFSDDTPAIWRRWANKIEVERAGDKLVISGTNPGKSASDDLLPLFHHYLFSPDREREAKGPHLEFASAKSDAKLIEFIIKWGPITAPYVGERDWSRKNPERNCGVQASQHKRASASLGEVRTTEIKRAVESLRRVGKVQAVIAAAATLLKISHEKNPDPETTLAAMSQLISALHEEWREFQVTPEQSLVSKLQALITAGPSLLKTGRGENADPETTLVATSEFISPLLEEWQELRARSGPTEVSAGCELGSTGLLVDCTLIHGDAKRRYASLKGQELSEFCRDLLCALLNRFPDNLISTEEGVLSVPAAGHGVLPLLMFMLRQDLVSDRRIIVCERCGDYFLQRRLGERACSSCKDALRAKRYYERKRGSILRRRKKKRRMLNKTKDRLELSK